MMYPPYEHLQKAANESPSAVSTLLMLWNDWARLPREVLQYDKEMIEERDMRWSKFACDLTALAHNMILDFNVYDYEKIGVILPKQEGVKCPPLDVY